MRDLLLDDKLPFVVLVVWLMPFFFLLFYQLKKAFRLLNEDPRRSLRPWLIAFVYFVLFSFGWIVIGWNTHPPPWLQTPTN